MIGMILNLTCNVEFPRVTEYLLTKDTMRMLTLILIVQRDDWPTNGAALAILQYEHQSLSNAELVVALTRKRFRHI